MSDQNEGWDTIEVPSKEEENKIEFEVEGEEEKSIEAVEEKPKEKVIEAAPQKEEVKEEPKELEGIKTKGAEKRIKQLIRQRKEREEQIEKLLAQNKELQDSLKTKSDDLVQVTSSSINTNEQNLERTVELARQSYLEAFESGDKDKSLAAQEALLEAKTELKAIKNWKNRVERQAKQQEQEQVQPQVQQQQQTQTVDPKAQEWAEENEWFGKDTIKTAAALALDAELKNEGYDPNGDEFYEEIDKRLETAFGQTSQRVQDNTKQPAQVVSGSSRSSPTSSKKVKLSKEDVRLANKWGIPLEQYAAEKMKVTQADGEYTDIR
tara:strand:+ start:1231 stop:2196 length:966 start_codon:yes stop_codon:yes gene_type:complete